MALLVRLAPPATNPAMEAIINSVCPMFAAATLTTRLTVERIPSRRHVTSEPDHYSVVQNDTYA